jgi:hypothetical protein
MNRSNSTAEVPTPVRAVARTQSRSFAPQTFSAQSKWHWVSNRLATRVTEARGKSPRQKVCGISLPFLGSPPFPATSAGLQRQIFSSCVAAESICRSLAEFRNLAERPNHPGTTRRAETSWRTRADPDSTSFCNPVTVAPLRLAETLRRSSIGPHSRKDRGFRLSILPRRRRRRLNWAATLEFLRVFTIV